MPGLSNPYILLRGALSPQDIESLRRTYSSYVPSSGLPCYAFLADQENPVLQQISAACESALSARVHYLNDFFFYTDKAFSTPWHVDTELYVFKTAVNAWILLEPDYIENPLGFISQLNNPSGPIYHSAEAEGDDLVFVNYATQELIELSNAEVESGALGTPGITAGDILLIDPQRFHRTNTSIPKGACVFKFVYSDDDCLMSTEAMPEFLWPEVPLYKRLLAASNGSWEHFLELVQKEITINDRDSALVSGFYPENFDHLSAKAKLLTSKLQ